LGHIDAKFDAGGGPDAVAGHRFTSDAPTGNRCESTRFAGTGSDAIAVAGAAAARKKGRDPACRPAGRGTRVNSTDCDDRCEDWDEIVAGGKLR
jgi:hypothetical protein